MTTPTDEVKKLHTDFVAEIHKREISSSENFDKSVLTFSSAGLALSVGFLKDFIPIGLAEKVWSLYASWWLFTGATCATMASFLVSSYALAHQKKLAYRYYIEGVQSAFEGTNLWDLWTKRLNLFSGGAFLLALILTVVFISTNLERAGDMKNQNTANKASSPDQRRGLTVPTMQPVPLAPATAPSQPAPRSSQPATSTPARKS